MNETMPNCRYNGAENPRVLPGRHVEDCEGDCAGCSPCPLAHCLGCYREHHDHVCPGCLADVRETLGEIGRLCDALPEEVEVKGVDSEAFNLLGPAADPEAVGHMRASVAVGRVPSDWLESADHELHPLQVCGTWMEAYLEAFDHDEPARITVESALSYLTRNLEHIGTEDDIPFRDFRRDLSACRTHLERVLHDGEQVETGAPCMTCEKPLLRVFGGQELPWKYRDGSRPLAPEDVWACRKCQEWRDEESYGLNVAQAHRDNADWLTAAEIEFLCDLKPATLRKRVERGDLISRRDSGRTVYRVDQIPEVLDARLADAS